MSEELFEKYLRNALDDVERRRLMRILDDPRGAREFAAFVLEWTLLAEAARGASVERSATLRPRSRRRLAALRRTGTLPWAFAGAAAAALFAVALALRPHSAPPPVPAPPPVAAGPPALPPPSEPPADFPPLTKVRRSFVNEPARAVERATDPAPPPVAPSVPAPAEPSRPAPPPPPPSAAPPPTVVERPAMAVVEAAEGQVSHARGAAMREEDVLRTGPGGRATAVVPSGVRFELGPDSVLSGPDWLLSKGRLTADVGPRRPGETFSLRTPHGEVRVLGTRFTVAVDALTRVEVLEGRVKVVRAEDGASREVAAGRTATLGRPGRWDLGWVEITREFRDAADTQLSEAEPARVFGDAAEITVDGDGPDGKSHWALLRWDLSGIPATALVRSAVLTLTITDAAPDMGYGIFEARRPWAEGGATWRLWAAGRPWRAPGGRSTADRGTEFLGTLAPGELGEHSILLNDAGLAVVQRWIRFPASNHGVFIGHAAMSDGFSFVSGEGTDVDKRPRLTITYVSGR